MDLRERIRIPPSKPFMSLVPNKHELLWSHSSKVTTLVNLQPFLEFVKKERQCREIRGKGTVSITTFKFSISLNNELTGFFPKSRGLKQGGPLSHYLFILAMEAFSRLRTQVPIWR
jgi:hypothetical protein